MGGVSQQEDVIAALVRRELNWYAVTVFPSPAGTVVFSSDFVRSVVLPSGARTVSVSGGGASNSSMLEGMAPLVDEDDRLVLLDRGLIGQEHVEVGRRRHGRCAISAARVKADRFSHPHLVRRERDRGPRRPPRVIIRFCERSYQLPDDRACRSAARVGNGIISETHTSNTPCRGAINRARFPFNRSRPGGFMVALPITVELPRTDLCVKLCAH